MYQEPAFTYGQTVYHGAEKATVRGYQSLEEPCAYLVEYEDKSNEWVSQEFLSSDAPVVEPEVVVEAPAETD